MKYSNQDKNLANKIITSGFYIIIGAAWGVFLLRNFGVATGALWLVLFAIFAIFAIPSLVACGVSLIVAKLSGYKLNRFVGYIFTIEQKNEKLNFSINPRWLTPATTFYPCQKKIGSAKTVMVAAFNIITYVVGAILLFFLYDITKNMVFLCLAVVFSLSALDSTILPMGNCQNNLAFIREILHHEERAIVQNNILLVNYLKSTGTRFRDMDNKLFEVFDLDTLGERLFFVNQTLRFSYFSDSNQFEKALAVSDSLINSLTLQNLGVHRGALRMDRVLHSLLLGIANDEVAFEYNHEDSEAFRERYKNASCVSAVNYAYALLYEKDEAKACEHLKAFNERVSNTPKMRAEREKEVIAMINERYY